MLLAALEDLSFDLVPAKGKESLPAKPDRQANSFMATAEERRVAMERLEFCRLSLSCKAETGRPMRDACEIVAIKHQDRFPSLLKAGKHGRSALTYDNCRNWLHRLGKGKDGRPDFSNSDALCDNYARGKRKPKGDERFWQTFYGLYLNSGNLSLPEAYRDAAAKIRKYANPFAVIPAEHQVRYQVSKLDIQEMVLSKEGEEAFKSKCMGFIRRDWDALLPGELFVADNRELDFPCKMWDKAKDCWVAKRAYVCMIIDAKSWWPVAWRMRLEPITGVMIANTFAEAIHNNADRPPATFYTDNGADFLKRGFGVDVEIEGHRHCIFRELGTEMLNAIAFNARAKPVERFFLDMANWFDRKRAGYLGNKPGARPDSAAFYYKHPEMLMSLNELEEAFSKYLEDYVGRPKQGKIHKGQSPLEIWQGKRFDVPAWTMERLRFAMLMPLPETRMVNRGLCLTINGVEYGSRELRHHLKKSVMVKVDWLDQGHVFAFEADGRLICECKTREAVKAFAKTEEDRRKIGEQMREQREELKESHRELNKLTGGLHLVSPAEILAAPMDAELIKVGEQTSVKGASHKFRVYKLQAPEEAKAELPAAPALETEISAPAPALDFKEDRDEAKLAEFGKAMAAKEEPTPKPTDEAMVNFHKMMTQRKRTEEDC